MEESLESYQTVPCRGMTTIAATILFGEVELPYQVLEDGPAYPRPFAPNEIGLIHSEQIPSIPLNSPIAEYTHAASFPAAVMFAVEIDARATTNFGLHCS